MKYGPVYFRYTTTKKCLQLTFLNSSNGHTCLESTNNPKTEIENKRIQLPLKSSFCGISDSSFMSTQRLKPLSI